MTDFQGMEFKMQEKDRTNKKSEKTRQIIIEYLVHGDYINIKSLKCKETGRPSIVELMEQIYFKHTQVCHFLNCTTEK